MTRRQLLQRRYKLLGKNAPLFYDEPLTIVKGEDVWLTDDNGKRYLDVYNNVPNVGHCHPHVVSALSTQAAQLNIHTRYLHETILDYAEKLTATLDDTLSSIFFTCSGSEANEIALRIARNHSGQRGIICTNATYHGNTAAVNALATIFNDGKPAAPDVKAVEYPCRYHPPAGVAADALADYYADQVAEAIAEFVDEGIGFAGLLFCPIFANEGVPDVPDGYLQKVANYVRAAGGTLIFDEVQSAFGRTGAMWAHDIAAVTPDILTLGKPMGNGHPLAAAICRQDLCDEFRDTNMYFNTFGGNPVSCAVGLAVLEVIEQENLLENVKTVSQYLRQGLLDLQKQYNLIGDVRNSGLFFAVELVDDPHSKAPAVGVTRQIVNQMKERGVLISRIGKHDNILKLRPPISFSTQHADLLLDNLQQTIQQNAV